MDKNLPVYKHKQEIVNAVNYNDTVIITAETGSGKSTQIPQYLYEAGYDVIITQPRRIACVSLANHVSEEMGDSLIPAYQTAFESNRTPMSHIIYCTDGLQLARGIENIDNTVLILDEVHEWNLYMETLIAWVKRYRDEGHKIKIVIMSATLDANALADYYGGAEIINIADRMYPVEKYFCESEDFEKKIIESIKEGRNVLAFLSGKREIDEAEESIREELTDENIQAKILQLHGELLIEEQEKVFEETNIPKLVLATNIAQTSLTIPDIDDVVDKGVAKIASTRNGIECLYEHIISKADIEQRAGRAGRTKSGRYFLCSYTKYDTRPDFGEPEIRRVDLDKVTLRLAAVGVNAATLKFFHAPEPKQLKNAREKLEFLGAIDEKGITELGKRLISMPISIEAALMLIEAEKYGNRTVDEAISCAAILQSGSLLAFGENRKGYSNFTDREDSDLLAEVEIFWWHQKDTNNDLIRQGLRPKAMIRAREYYQKLTKMSEDILTINKEAEYNENNIYRVIATGLILNFARCCPWWISTRAYDAKIPYESCIPNPEYFTYEEVWENEEEQEEYDDIDMEYFVVGLFRELPRVTLITLGTVIPNGIMIEVLKRFGATTQMETSTMKYYAEDKTFRFVERITFRCLGDEEEKSYFRNVSEGNEEYDDLFKRFQDCVKEAPENHIVVNNNHHRLERKKEDNRLHLVLDSSEIMKIPFNGEILNANGEEVILEINKYGKNEEMNTVGEAKEKIKEDYFAINKYPRWRKKFSYAKQSVGDLRDMIRNVGKKDVTFEVTGETRTFFIGLKEYNGNFIDYSEFNSLEEARASVQPLLIRAFTIITRNTFLREDDFMQLENNQYTFTDYAKSQHKEMVAFCEERIPKVVPENMVEIFKEIKEKYEKIHAPFKRKKKKHKKIMAHDKTRV